jgi:hypothetical protein
MHDELDAAIDELRDALPPIFLGSRINKLTGDAINWGTIQNKRSKGQIPDGCFLRSGVRVLVRRDPFLNWWRTTLTDARRALHRGHVRRRHGQSKSQTGE